MLLSTVYRKFFEYGSLHSNNHLIPDKICLVGVRAGTGTEHAQYVHQKQEIQLKKKIKWWEYYPFFMTEIKPGEGGGGLSEFIGLCTKRETIYISNKNKNRNKNRNIAVGNTDYISCSLYKLHNNHEEITKHSLKAPVQFMFNFSP